MATTSRAASHTTSRASSHTASRAASRASRFEALGSCLPDRVQPSSELVATAPQVPELPLERLTGVVTRRVADESPGSAEHSFGLALSAARDALRNSRYEAGELDVVISTSISRSKGGNIYYFEPSFARMLIEELGAHRALHFDLSNACAGMLTGVQILDRMIRQGMVRNGMVVSGERITPIARTAAAEMPRLRHPQFASLTVGDAGAAVILDESEDEADRIHYVELMTASAYSHLCLAMPSEHRADLAMYTDSGTMQARDRMKIWSTFYGDFLAKNGSDFASEGFDYVIHHQVTSRFIDVMQGHGAESFGAPMPRSLSVVEHLGNTASTSHFMALSHHLRAGTARQGAKYLLVPAASGVVTGCLSVTISNLGV
ncbi:3-oxoacyl-[acyl-carrier-protein] synthase III C-terminal domain-containing protein [Streptomyces sp. NPDC093085]|uniref:3-oxoacyl-ACP synthase III family protein n=1 Tax=Streptomyces sp. NPDC093085 TaxID=3155068 RepID=UPI0034123547